MELAIGYAICADGDDKNEWYKRCKKDNRLFVAVTTKDDMHRVDWDHTSVDTDYSNVDMGQTNLVVQNYIRGLRAALGTKKSTFCGSALVGGISSLSLRSAKKIASLMFEELNPIVEGANFEYRLKLKKSK